MADNIIRTGGTAPNYKLDRGGVTSQFGPFIGIVKNNADPTRQGRLQVYIEQFAGGNPDDKTAWTTVSYCPPFYGATPPRPGKKGDTDSVGGYLDGNPQSYGMWFIPPDVGTIVMVIFIDGDHSYEGALKDIANYYPKVKSGGIFAGHDYYWPGVNRAIGDFLTKDYDKINVLQYDVWYVEKK